MSSTKDTINDLTNQLMSLLGYENMAMVDENDGAYTVQINAEDTGVLIGYHGQTLAAIQTVLGHMVFKRTGEWVKLSVNVSDYWQKRESQLEAMAMRAVDEVLSTGSSYTLPYLNSRERRHIHVLLQNNQGVSTESVGEGDQRRLVIFPATPKA